VRAEEELAKQGLEARIVVKANALVDPELIEALYAASRAGVEIRLIIRGICCLRPGVEGLSETIRVVSIVDRLLEHSRIFHFRHGGDDLVFIASADWMPRNLNRRLETLVPVEDPRARERLLAVLRCCLADSVKGRLLRPDGTYGRNEVAGASGPRSQEALYEAAREAVQAAREARITSLEPHRAPRVGT
jgi:polyphosphate kinase